MKIHPFTIKITAISNGAGVWNSNQVEIFKEENKVGEYTRYYGAFTESTFCPVKYYDKWYALISSDYELVEIMDLQTGSLIPLSEESKKQMHGMCPTEIFCPFIYAWEGGQKKHYSSCYDWDFKDESENDDTEIYYSRIAYVSGCIWGDDSSWKLNFLDLRGIEKGDIFYVNEFLEKEWFYHELPAQVSLLSDIYSDYDYDESENLNEFILTSVQVPTCKYVSFSQRDKLTNENKRNIVKSLLELTEKEHPEFKEEYTTGWDLIEGAKKLLKELE